MSRILVVDDSRDLGRSLVQILAAAGYQAEAVRGGAECLATLRDRPHDFGVVLLDLRMPDIDGIGVVNLLPTGSPPIIIMTGAYEDIPKSVPPAAVRHFLYKPFESAELFRKIEDVLGHAGPQTP